MSVPEFYKSIIPFVEPLSSLQREAVFIALSVAAKNIKVPHLGALHQVKTHNGTCAVCIDRCYDCVNGVN